MNISCSICAELFRGPDAHNLNITRCGHLFHNECLAKWLERYAHVNNFQHFIDKKFEEAFCLKLSLL